MPAAIFELAGIFVPAANFAQSAKFVLAGIFVPAAKFCYQEFLCQQQNFVLAGIFGSAANFVLVAIFCACRNICVLFVLLLYVPGQQLWSWRDGQLT